MYPGGPNPTQIQTIPPARAAASARDRPPPLVLIHDGGGTTFSYFLLGNLDRDVWAVHNTQYFEGGLWEGGLDEMATTYLDAMVTEGIQGGIMLGGWSLGGLLSIAIAHLVARKPDEYPLHIAGLLLIDSPYHIARSKVTRPYASPQLTNLPDLVQAAFASCDKMLQNWDLPRWSGAGNKDAQKQTCEFTAPGGWEFKLNQSDVLFKPATGGAKSWSIIQIKTCTEAQPEPAQEEAAEAEGAKAEAAKAEAQADAEDKDKSDTPPAPGLPPPAVLIRCTKATKTKPESPDGVPCLVDLDRAERLLGWEGRYADFFRAVIDVDAEHYGMFDRNNQERIKDVTARVGWALDILDGINVSSMAK
ncbi:hypothetical protein E4U21_002800 [Claviceps maximensis]|nr:hypothetical protein E4U21_002800 [Claviceps maximensis]